jgi:hypothetical protein
LTRASIILLTLQQAPPALRRENALGVFLTDACCAFNHTNTGKRVNDNFKQKFQQVIKNFHSTNYESKNSNQIRANPRIFFL